MVRDGKLITPPVTDDILEGITRTGLMQLARQELGIEPLMTRGTVVRQREMSEVLQGAPMPGDLDAKLALIDENEKTMQGKADAA